ncbi:hypothetical protein L9F63_016851, partial [Diploptera punctata]
YAWGKRGRNSEVALLNSSGDPDFMIDDNMPYAELWMGTHPNGPSILKGSSQKLSEWIVANPESLGYETREKFGVQLPFLFKVLSVNQALSVQAHPDKAHAEKLHRERPDIYKDPNHKPELAIALTPFEALCGFRPIAEIKNYLETIPELRSVIGQESINELLTSDEAGMQQALKNCFHALMNCCKITVETQLNILAKRLADLDESSLADQTMNLFLKLHKTYPGDVGCFSVFFLNYLVLQLGEAIFLGPNEPHAYLFGDCIECMACSDNVVRAGLTPKYKDVETLCNMLTYICEPASSKVFEGIVENEFTVMFSPPVPDFAVAKISIPIGAAEVSLIPRDSASLLIVISGQAECNDLNLDRGSVLFIPAKQKIDLLCNESEDPILMFQAMIAAHVWSEKHNINSDTKLLKQLENTNELTIWEKIYIQKNRNRVMNFDIPMERDLVWRFFGQPQDGADIDIQVVQHNAT